MRLIKRSYAEDLVLEQYPHLDPRAVAHRLRGCSFVSLPRRFMYYEVPKAACTAMKQLLLMLEDAPPIEHFVPGHHETRRDMFIHARKNVPLPSLLDLDDALQKEVLQASDFFRFTVVRNPYSRLLSAWKSKVMLCEPGFEFLYEKIKGALPAAGGAKSLISFPEFVEYIIGKCDLQVCNPHWRRQIDHTFFAVIKYSFVGKLEELAETAARLQRHLGGSEPLPLNDANSSGSSVSVAFDSDLADTIYQAYCADFEAFGYDRHAWQSYQRGDYDPDRDRMVSEDKYCDEIVERNLVIAHLYQECQRFQAEQAKGLARPLWGGYRKLRRATAAALEGTRRLRAVHTKL